MRLECIYTAVDLKPAILLGIENIESCLSDNKGKEWGQKSCSVCCGFSPDFTQVLFLKLFRVSFNPCILLSCVPKFFI